MTDNKKKKSNTNKRGNSPPLQGAGRDASIATSAEGESVSSGIFLPRESCYLISRYLKLAEGEAGTALKEIEDCLSKDDVPGVRAFRTAVQKIIGDLRFHSDCIHSFAKFSSYGPEHVMEAKRMIAGHHYAWACFDKQLDAVESGDEDTAEFWRQCFVAFCVLWGDHDATDSDQQKLYLTARAYAEGETELSPDEIMQLQDFKGSLDH